jgi:hypothetical protein
MQLSFCALRPASALSTQYPATISSLSCKVTECGTDQFAFTLDGCLTWEDNNEELVNCEVTPGSTLPCPYPEWNRVVDPSRYFKRSLPCFANSPPFFFTGRASRVYRLVRYTRTYNFIVVKGLL